MQRQPRTFRRPSAERQKEEQDERDLVARQEQADEEKRRREYNPFSDESIWTRRW